MCGQWYRRAVRGMLPAMVLVLSLPAWCAAEGRGNIGAAPSAEYGNGPYVAYAFDRNYTAYGVGRGATREAAQERAQRNCTGPSCQGGEKGVFKPGCLAIMKTAGGPYLDFWDVTLFGAGRALNKCRRTTGSPCGLEVFICSNQAE